MDYQLQTLVTELEDLLGRQHLKHEYLRERTGSKDANLEWGAASFFAEALMYAEGNYYFVTEQRLNEVHSDFCKRHNVEVDLLSLFTRNFLRKVLGRIRVAGQVNSDLYTFKGLQPYRTELRFLLEMEVKHKLSEGKVEKVLSKEMVEAEIPTYEDQHKVTLNRDGIFYVKWYNTEKEQFSSLEHYFKHYIEYYAEFHFLQELSGIIVSETKLVISTDELVKIHTAHHNKFPAIPSLEELAEAKELFPTTGGYLLHLRSGIMAELIDPISGRLWELLLQSSGQTEEEALMLWMNKVEHFNMLADPFSHVTSSSGKRLLDVAMQCVLNEPDLVESGQEKNKLILEGGHRLHYYTYQPEKILAGTPDFNSEDIYELYHSIQAFDEHFQNNMLYDQASRYTLLTLVRIIVLHDEQYSRKGNPAQEYFTRVKQLLAGSISRPYLLYQVTDTITQLRSKLLPYLLCEPNYTTLALAMLDELKLASEEQSRPAIWRLSASLLLTMISVKGLPSSPASLIIYRLFILINRKRMKQYPTGKTLDRNIAHHLSETVMEVLENHPLGLTHVNQSERQYLLPSLYEELAAYIIGYSEQELSPTNSLYFPIFYWHGLSWLLKISFDLRYTDQLHDKDATRMEIANAFLHSYRLIMQQEQKTDWKNYSDHEEDKYTYWGDDGSRTEIPEWSLLAIVLHKQGKLSEFIVQDFKFRKAEDKFDPLNRLTAGKIRAHISVLLELLKQLKQTGSRILFEKELLEEISKQTEEGILLLLQNHSHVPAEGKFDVLEEAHGLTKTEPLISQIARALHGFSHPHEFINAIIASGDMAKMLALLDHVTSESLRAIIINLIKDTNIDQLLESYHWVPEIEFVFVRISKYPELVEHTEKAIGYWRDKVTKSKDNREYKETLYNVELLQAYLKSDIELLNTIEPPPRTFDQNTGGLSKTDYKDFYRALLLMKDEPAKSYQLFDNVYSRKPQYLTFGLNRTLAKLALILKKTNNSSADMIAAYQEWTRFKESLSGTSLEKIEPEYSQTELRFLQLLKEFEKADKLMEGLPVHIKFSPEVLDTRVQSLMERERIAEASYLVRQADEYHYYPGTPEPSFIAILKDRLDGLDRLEDLQGSYLRIMAVEPAKLVRIFPSSFNGQRTLVPFLIKEIALAVDKLLEKIKSIEEIGLEDKYNDLVEVVINARISVWHWTVAAQSRGAYSGGGDTGKQPGERDLPIVDNNAAVLLVCEAFIYRDKKRTEEHLQKVFNYHHRRDAFCMLIYDTGEASGTFQQHFSDYCSVIVPGTKFPEGYEISGDIEDVSKRFVGDHAAIRISKSTHKSGTEVYHIFVNIRYHVK